MLPRSLLHQYDEIQLRHLTGFNDEAAPRRTTPGWWRDAHSPRNRSRSQTIASTVVVDPIARPGSRDIASWSSLTIGDFEPRFLHLPKDREHDRIIYKSAYGIGVWIGPGVQNVRGPRLFVLRGSRRCVRSTRLRGRVGRTACRRQAATTLRHRRRATRRRRSRRLGRVVGTRRENGWQRYDESDRIPDEEIERALVKLDDVWSTLSPAEQIRVIETLIEFVEFDGQAGKLRLSCAP